MATFDLRGAIYRWLVHRGSRNEFLVQVVMSKKAASLCYLEQKVSPVVRKNSEFFFFFFGLRNSGREFHPQLMKEETVLVLSHAGFG